MKMRAAILLLCLLAPLAIAAQTVYVSSSRGDDAAAGADAGCPVRTIAKARALGKDIRLRQGDVFYEYLRGGGFALSSYSDDPQETRKPVICGFRIIPVEVADTAWKRGTFLPDGTWAESPEGSIYRLDLMGAGFRGYTGTVRENPHKNIHNVGAIYDPAGDIIHGRKCQCTDSVAFAALTEPQTDSPYRYLCKDYDFYQEGGDYRYLYVMASSRELLTSKELWLSMGADGIRGADYSATGIKFMGWGKTAVRGGSNITVTDCDFDVIGGSTHEYNESWIRFGNGVEFWADQAVGCEVSGCRFTRVFDTATTIQGPMSAAKGSRCSDIHIHHNVITRCRQDFEVWVNSADGLMPSNCSFTHNKGYDSGDNGFETQEYNNTHLLHYILSPYKVSDILITDNEFHDGMGLYYANSAMSNMHLGHNRYYCQPGSHVIRGLYGKLEIEAPVRVGGKWKYATGLTPDGETIYGWCRSKRLCLKRFNAFINSLVGGGELEVIF